MPENVDVAKMKVADLKRELKLRGLSITGNKTELAERLQASDFSFEDTTISGEDLLEDEDAVLTDEEKILDENELLKSPRGAGGATLDTSTIGGSIASTAAFAGAKKVVLKRKISSNIGITTNDVNTTVAAKDKNNTTTTKLIKMNDDETKETGKSDDNNGITATAAAAAAIKQVTKLTAKERLELRAKKFGLTSATNATAADSSNKNAVVENDSSAKNLPTSINSEKEAQLLKKRAERFGCVVSSKMVQLDAAERLQKRKERFGGAATTTTTKATVLPNSAAPTVTTDVWAEKARLRLERFKTNKTGSTITTTPTTTATN